MARVRSVAEPDVFVCAGASRGEAPWGPGATRTVQALDAKFGKMGYARGLELVEKAEPLPTCWPEAPAALGRWPVTEAERLACRKRFVAGALRIDPADVSLAESRRTPRRRRLLRPLIRLWRRRRPFLADRDGGGGLRSTGGTAPAGRVDKQHTRRSALASSPWRRPGPAGPRPGRPAPSSSRSSRPSGSSTRSRRTPARGGPRSPRGAVERDRLFEHATRRTLWAYRARAQELFDLAKEPTLEELLRALCERAAEAEARSAADPGVDEEDARWFFTKKELNGSSSPRPDEREELPVTLRGLPNKVAVIKPGNSSGTPLLYASTSERVRLPLPSVFGGSQPAVRAPKLRNMSSALSVASSLDMIDPALFGRDGALFSCGAPAPAAWTRPGSSVASILAAAPDAEKEKLMEKELVGRSTSSPTTRPYPGRDFNEGGFDVCVVAMGGRTYDVNAEKEKPKEKELVGALDLFAYNSAVPQGGDFNEGGFDVCVVAMGGRTYDVNAEKEKPKEKELVGALDLFAYNSDVPQGGDFNEGCFDFCIVAMGGRTYDVNAAGRAWRAHPLLYASTSERVRLLLPSVFGVGARSRPFALQRARSNEAFACALSSERFPFRLRNMSSALSVASSLDMIDPALFGRDGALFSCGAPAPGGLDSARLPPVASILAPPLVATPWLLPPPLKPARRPSRSPRAPAAEPRGRHPEPRRARRAPSALPVAVPAPARHVDLGPCAPLRRRRVVRCSVCRLTGHNKKTHDRVMHCCECGMEVSPPEGASWGDRGGGGGGKGGLSGDDAPRGGRLRIGPSAEGPARVEVDLDADETLVATAGEETLWVVARDRVRALDARCCAWSVEYKFSSPLSRVEGAPDGSLVVFFEGAACGTSQADRGQVGPLNPAARAPRARTNKVL
eukprot:tig00021440_g21532.t1